MLDEDTVRQQPSLDEVKEIWEDFRQKNDPSSGSEQSFSVLSCSHASGDGYFSSSHLYYNGAPRGRTSVAGLVQEVVDQGFGRVLDIPERHRSAGFATLQEFAAHFAHRLTGQDNDDVLVAQLLAMLLYTGTDVYSAFNADKRNFFVVVDAQQYQPPFPDARFPVLDELLVKAGQNYSSDLAGPSKHSTPLFVKKPTFFAIEPQRDRLPTLWCGMHNVFLSPEVKAEGKFRLAQNTSMSENRHTAEQFLKQVGTLIQVVECQVSSLTLPLSWISKFPQESEVLLIAGAEFIISKIETTLTSLGHVDIVTVKYPGERIRINRSRRSYC